MLLCRLLLLISQTTTVYVKADLNYYLYINEVDNAVVLESLGTLPFHKSISTQDNDGSESCLAIVHDEGGINPHYLCLGPHSVGGIEFFPIVTVNNADASHDGLPFKFSKFEQSYGVFSPYYYFVILSPLPPQLLATTRIVSKEELIVRFKVQPLGWTH